MENLEALDLPDMHVVFDNVKQLPSIPIVVQQLISNLSDPDLNMESLSRQINLDQSLSASVLKIANSAYYGARRKVASVQDAAMILGINTVRSVAVMAGLISAFPESSAIDREQFWRDNIKAAICAKAIADYIGEDTGIAYTVGALHSIGIMVMDVSLKDKFSDIVRTSQQSGTDLLECERNVLGFDHSMVGAELARRWNFPYVIQHAIRYYHQPDHEPFEVMTGIVYLAHQLIKEDLSAGPAGDIVDYIPEVLQQRLNLDSFDFWTCLPSDDELNAQVDMLLKG